MVGMGVEFRVVVLSQLKPTVAGMDIGTSERLDVGLKARYPRWQAIKGKGRRWGFLVSKEAVIADLLAIAIPLCVARWHPFLPRLVDCEATLLVVFDELQVVVPEIDVTLTPRPAP